VTNLGAPVGLSSNLRGGSLPPIHRDPFDRVLVALAQMQILVVLTSDENIPKYPGVKTI
jgi:PIN domain nuclease of toxin-antitoxin system